MQLQVTDDWRIRTDAHCYRVERYCGVYNSGKHHNQPKYEAVKYAATLAAAVRCLTDCMIRESETTTVLEALAGVQKVAEAIDCALIALEYQAEQLQNRQRYAQDNQRPVIQAVD